MPSKIRIVLEGYARYRDGKKWKKRYCVLSLSPTNLDALHLYITKSYDDFAAYRNSGSVLTAMLPVVRKPHELPISPESRSLLGESAVVQRPSDQTHMSSSTLLQQNTSTNYSLTSSSSSSGPLVNTAAYSCVAALESTASGLATASNLASSVGGPAPVDEITGFESGYHMDKESNIIVLIGGSSVYALALSGMDEMFRWADNLARIVVDNRFRVTLRHTGDGSKLFQGLQGSLHVQHWRLCLIGEPSSGCKFICNWRLDHVEKAYTMTMPAQNANQFFTSNNTTNNSNSSSSISNSNSGNSNNNNTSTISSNCTTTTNNPTIGMSNSASMSSSVTISSASSTNTGHSQALDIHHRTSGSFGSGSRNLTGVSAATTTTNSNSTPNNTNKYLFFMECSPASGKGRGSYIFEIDGSRLVELTIAIEQFTALRYNSNLKPATSAEAAQLTVAAQSALGTSSFNPVDCCNNIFRSNPVCAIQPNGCIVHDDVNNIASSFSSDTSSNPRSISPTHHHHHQQQQLHRNQQQHQQQQQQQQEQQQLRKRRSRDSIFNPLRKISSGHHHNFNLFNKTNDYQQASTIDRIPNKQVSIPPQLNSQSSMPVMMNSKCSWSLQRTSSLSPPDILTTNDLVGDMYSSNSLSRPAATTSSISAVQAAISAIKNIQEGNNSPIDIANLLTKSLQNHDVSSLPNHQDPSICSHSPLFIGTGVVHGGGVQPHHHHHHHHHHPPHLPTSSYRLNDDTPTPCSLSASLTATSSSTATTASGYDLIDNMSDTNYFLHDNVQVAKVAAGLIISKKPPYYYNNNNNNTSNPNNSVCAYPTRTTTTTCLTSICATSFSTSITGHRQAPLLPPPPPSSRPPPPHHHHQHHPHSHQHQRLIFENNQSSTGCNTTAVLPSVPIPSIIGTDISNTHSGMQQHSSSLQSNECCSSGNSSNRLQFRQPSRDRQYHHISSSNPISTSQLSDSLYTSSSDYSNYGLVNSLTTTESTLDQVDNKRDSGVTSQPATMATTAAVAPSSNNNSNVNPEVFTTDEDYWDLRTTSSNSSNQWKSQLYSSKTNLTGVDGDCSVAKKSNYSSVITDLPTSTTLGSLSHTCCKELLSNDTCGQYKLAMDNTAHNPYSFYYSSSIEPEQCIYRRRLQQYRVCLCKSLLRRSFSANTNLQLIDISNKLQNDDEYRTSMMLRTMRSLDSCCAVTTTTTSTTTAAAAASATTTNDEHNLIHQNLCGQYSRCCRTTESSNSNSNISIRPPPPAAPLSSGKLLCGGGGAGAGRFQRIHRLFQRKHSQSHDSLQSRKNSMDDRPGIFNDSEYSITTGSDGGGDDKSSFDKPLHSDMLPWDGIDELKQVQHRQQQEKHLNASHTDNNNNDKSVELSCRVLNCPRHGIRRLHWSIDPQQILLLTNNRKVESLSQLKKLMKSRVTTTTASSFVVHEKHSTPTILPSNSPNTVIINSTTTAAVVHYSPVVSARWRRNRRTHPHHYFTRKIDSKAKGLYLNENNNSDSDLITSQAIRTNNCPHSANSEITHSLSPLRKHSSTSSAMNQLHGYHYYYNYYNAVSSSPSERSQSLISVNSLPCSEPSLSKIDNNNNNNNNNNMHSLLHMNYTDSMELLLAPSHPPPSSIHRWYDSSVLLRPTPTTTTTTSTNQQEVNSSSTDPPTDRQFYILPKFNRSVSSSVKPFALPSSTSSFCNSTLRASTLPTTRILRDDEQSINENTLLLLTTAGSNHHRQQQHSYVNSRLNVVDNPDNPPSTTTSGGGGSSTHHHQKSNRLQSSVSSNLDRLLPLLLQRTSTNTRQNAISSSVQDKTGVDAVGVVSGSNNSMPRKFSYQSSEVDSSPRVAINSNNNNNYVNTVNRKQRRRKSINEEINDKTTTTTLQVDEQLSSDIHTYNNLIRLQEYPTSMIINDDSTVLHGLKSIPPTSLSSSSVYDPTTSQFLHLTIHEENGTSCQSQPPSSSSSSSSSTTSYVNFPGFWSNLHSTTSASSVAASVSAITSSSSMENRLYANLMHKTNQKYTKHSNNNINNNSKGTLLSQLPMNNAHCDITTSAGQSLLYTGGEILHHSTDSHYLPQATTTATTINLLSKSNNSPGPTISLGGSSNLMPSSTSQCSCCSPVGGVYLPGASPAPLPPPSVVNMPTETDYSCLPAEVRDPSRNYAMVDLRPSPASSTLPPTELTLSINHQHHHHINEHTSQSCSSSSIDDSICSNSGASLTHNGSNNNNNNSTSTTGSDCTSDAATLTSDTIENYSTVCNPPCESSSLSCGNKTMNNNNNTSKVKSKISSMDTDSCDRFMLMNNTMTSRRRHSHSLSSSSMTTDPPPPILNYVHVIAAAGASNTRFTSTETARSSDPSSVSDPNHIGSVGVGGIITEFGNSPSSSSGLGGVTSQSNASSLAAPASSTSFGDIFSCRSMTSSGTSSVEGGNNNNTNTNPEMMMVMAAATTDLSSCSPSDDNCVIYTQIDFTRTMALGELSNDIMAQENQTANNITNNINSNNNRLSSSMIASRNSTITNMSSTNNNNNTGTTSSSSSRNKIDRTTSVKKTLYRSIRLIGGRGSRKKVG